jgi:hypothetical protein
MHFTRRSFVTTFIATTVAFPAFAAKPAFFSRNGAAINGYDPVAYFTQTSPQKGSLDHSLNWQGAIWLFQSAENKALFEANPGKYAPQYGGYCAYAVSKGATAKTEPDAWTIQNGKLYLNYNTEVRSLWKLDVPGNISRADANWPAVLDR